MIKINGKEFEVNGLTADKLFSKGKIMNKVIHGKLDRYVCLQIPLGYSASRELMKRLKEFNGDIEIEDSLVIAKFRPYDANLHSNKCDGKAILTLHFNEITIIDKITNTSCTDYMKFGSFEYPCVFTDNVVEIKFSRDAKQINFIQISANAQNKISEFFDVFSSILINKEAVIEIGDESRVLTSVQSRWMDIQYYFDCFPMDTEGENLLIRGNELCG